MRVPQRKFCFGVLLLLCAIWPAWAQQYRFDQWTTDNGLPQNTVRSIVKTQDGYLWLTTFDGLVRFDGLNFKVFNKANTPGLSSNRLTRLYEDRAGALYISTEKDGIVRYRNGVFQSFTSAEGYPSRFNCVFLADPNGEMVIGTTDKGAFYLREGKFIPAPAALYAKESGSYLASSGNFWTTDRDAVNRRNREGETRRFLLPSVKGKFALRPIALLEDKSGNFWAGNSEQLFLIREETIRKLTARDMGLAQGFAPLPLGEDRDGGVWFWRDSIGDAVTPLVRYANGNFTSYEARADLPDTGINSFLADDEGNIWLGSNAGLFRLRRQLITTYSVAQGLAAKEVYPLLQTNAGDILIGTIRGLNLWRNGIITTLPLITPSPLAQALTEDHKGRWWIGKTSGLLRYEAGRTRDLSHLVENQKGNPATENNVTALLTDRRGHVWAGTLRGLYELADDQIVNHYTTENGLPGNEVVALLESRDGAMWIGVYGGLTRWKEGRMTTYTAAQGLTGNRVRALHEDDEGALWIGTYDEGLSRFKEGKFTNYRETDGLFNNGVFAILPDKRGSFWISCNKGIYRVRRSELNDFADGKINKITSTAFGKAEGMLNIECNGGRQPAGFVARDGKLWFPTQDGVAVIEPEAERFNAKAPPVIIEGVSIDRQAQPAQSVIELQPGQTNLEISYAGLSFVQAEQVKFKYLLAGQDATWVDAGTRRIAYYSYLPPGDYNFQVMAANAQGVWNLQAAQIRVKVLAPFYRRTWFWVLCALALAGATVALFHRREQQARERQGRQELFARQLIEAQEEERKRIAAGLHDSLGQVLLIIKNRAFLGQRAAIGEGEAEEKITTAGQQFGEISTATSDAISQVSEIAYYLRPSQLERLGLVAAIEEMLNQVEDASGMNFSFEADDLSGAFPPNDEINFFRIVQESANNVVKHSGATQAQVTIRRNGKNLELIVSDNGTGFDTQLRKPGSRVSGFGLTGMAERAKILGGQHSIKSTLGEGTTVRVNIVLPG